MCEREGVREGEGREGGREGVFGGRAPSCGAISPKQGPYSSKKTKFKYIPG